MKKLNLLFAVIILFASSCEKEEVFIFPDLIGEKYLEESNSKLISSEIILTSPNSKGEIEFTAEFQTEPVQDWEGIQNFHFRLTGNCWIEVKYYSIVNGKGKHLFPKVITPQCITSEKRDKNFQIDLPLAGLIGEKIQGKIYGVIKLSHFKGQYISNIFEFDDLSREDLIWPIDTNQNKFKEIKLPAFFNVP